MNERIVWTIAAAFGLTACAHLHGGPTCGHEPCAPPASTPQLCRPIRVDGPIGEEEACATWRQVGLKKKPGADCPVPKPAAGGERWQVRQLFAAAPSGALPPALRPFCLYEHGEKDPGVARELGESLRELVGRRRLARVDPGCAVVAPADSTELSPRLAPADELKWPLLRDHFLEQAGYMEPGRERFRVMGLDQPPRARLAFLDTQPTGEIDRRGNSEHGYTLAQVARRLICEPGPGAPCAARVVPRLALPITELDPDDPGATVRDWHDGGYFGTVDELAQAVWEELGSWRASAQEHLVLNLSVAWVGELYGGLEEGVTEMPVPVQALHRVLEVASCEGALAVAAAGNRVGGPEEEHGPLLPGGWERRDAPRPAACRRLLGTGGVPAPAREPLVYAAGGVRTDGSPLANARPGATPLRVAYGDHAVVTDDQGEPSAILTGTSVSTTVIAATAAAVWHRRPELARAELMELLYETGEALGRDADFYRGSPRRPPAVRRITLCPALTRACAGGEGPCPGTCPPRSQEPPRLPRTECESARFDDATRVDAGRITETLGRSSLCDAREIRFDPAGRLPVDPCPYRQYFGIAARPWTGPQPQSDPCAGCSIDPPPPPSGLVESADLRFAPTAESTYTLRIDVDPQWPGGELRQAFLDIGDVSFALDLKPLTAGECALVEGVDATLLAPGDDGTRPPVALRFVTDAGRRGDRILALDVPVFVSR